MPRGKRSSAYRKLSKQYARQFGFREPYEVIVDCSFLKEAAKPQLDVKAKIRDILQAEVRLYGLPCGAKADQLSRIYGGPVFRSLSAPYSIEKFQHTDNRHIDEIGNRIEPKECLSLHDCYKAIFHNRSASQSKKSPTDTKPDTNLKSDQVEENAATIKKPIPLVVATADTKARAYLSKLPGVPVITFNKHGVLVLDDFSKASKRLEAAQEMQKLTAGLKPKATLGKRKRDEADDADGSNAPASSKLKTPHRAKGPNPLSMKKPKVRVPLADRVGARVPPTTEKASAVDNPDMQSGSSSTVPPKKKVCLCDRQLNRINETTNSPE